MFVFIKSQLFNEEHPLNKIASNFVYNYVDYWGNQILTNAEKFNVTK